ncbi:MAG: hypothetical protein ACXW4Q_03205 [Anaerolineales bacterium]
MTTLASVSPAGETALQKELELFGELFARLRDTFLNRIFDLRPERAARRWVYLIFLFFFVGFLITLTHENYSLGIWAQYLQQVFIYVFNPFYAGNVGNPIENFLWFAWGAFTDPYTLQYVPILLASFFIALQSAALYLADVFELEEVRVARRFVRGVALSGSNETIRISQGGISEESRELPTYLIGGPGKVTVDLDSVALFEKPDGTPRVVGPTAKEPRGSATLGGFERFRQAIDIRDHYADLSVTSRSRDGIPITATDVHMMFSVHRGGKKATSEFPYPFSEKAIQQLIYKALSKVTPDLINPSTHEFSWISNMISLIRSELGGFMSQHNLTEYLASIGLPEFERAKAQEAIIAAQARQLSVPVEEVPKAQEVKPSPDFTPRREITNLFGQFAQKFSDIARERGVELHWIGVGTWKTSPEIDVVPEKHLEAWKLSQENLYRKSQEELGRLEQEAITQKMVTLIQDVPVAVYQRATDEEREHNNALRSLLLAYRQQLIEAAEFMREKGETVSPIILQAIKIISEVMGLTDWHWVPHPPSEPDEGAASSDQPQDSIEASATPRTEESAFNELVQLVGGNQATAERLVRFERIRFPNGSRLALIEQAIARILRDRQ